jgi:hypothetical protein
MNELQFRNLEILWDYLRIDSKLPESADAIIVGGAALMTDMAQRAAELYHKNISQTIVVSGYEAADSQSGESEAVLMKRILLADGVSNDDILLDEKASNTGENITNSEQILRDLGILAQKIILVHKPFMTRRFLATAEAQWSRPQPEFYVTSVNMPFKHYYYLHHQAYPDDPHRIIRSMLGDYERIKKYPSRGFSSYQEFCQVAENAYQSLIASGLNSRSINNVRET